MRTARTFDDAVAEIRSFGVPPKHKPFGKKKADCTAYQWACHLEYMACRYRDPVLKARHKKYQIKYLAKRR